MGGTTGHSGSYPLEAVSWARVISVRSPEISISRQWDEIQSQWREIELVDTFHMKAILEHMFKGIGKYQAQPGQKYGPFYLIDGSTTGS